MLNSRIAPKMANSLTCLTLVLSATILLPNAAQAQLSVDGVRYGPARSTERPPLYLGVHGGTLGVGLHGGFFFSENFSVKGSFDYMDIEGNYDDPNLENEKMRLKNASGLVALNYHPGGGNTHLSLGTQLFAPEASFAADGTYTANTGTANYSFNGSVRPEWDVGLYAGVGYSARLRATPGLAFFGDLGVSYMGKADTKVDITLDCNVAGFTAAEVTECSSLADDFRDAIDDYDISYLYPVVRLGLSYRF